MSCGIRHTVYSKLTINLFISIVSSYVRDSQSFRIISFLLAQWVITVRNNMGVL